MINSEWKGVTTYQMNLIIQSSQPKFYKADHFLHKTQISQTLSSNRPLCSATRKLEIIDIKKCYAFQRTSISLHDFSLMCRQGSSVYLPDGNVIDTDVHRKCLTQYLVEQPLSKVIKWTQDSNTVTRDLTVPLCRFLVSLVILKQIKEEA